MVTHNSGPGKPLSPTPIFPDLAIAEKWKKSSLRAPAYRFILASAANYASPGTLTNWHQMNRRGMQLSCHQTLCGSLHRLGYHSCRLSPSRVIR